MAIKISILLMYRRIFSVDSPFRLHSLLLGIAVVAFWFASTVATIFYCRPFGYSWMGLELEKHCFDYNAFWMATGIIEVVIDIVILALPVRMVLKIQLTRKKRALITFIFLLGSLQVLLFFSLVELLPIDPIDSDFLSASSSRASFASFMATSSAGKAPPIPKPNSGRRCTSAWASSAHVCPLYGLSSPTHHILQPAPFLPPFGGATTICEVGIPQPKVFPSAVPVPDQEGPTQSRCRLQKIHRVITRRMSPVHRQKKCGFGGPIRCRSSCFSCI